MNKKRTLIIGGMPPIKMKEKKKEQKNIRIRLIER